VGDQAAPVLFFARIKMHQACARQCVVPELLLQDENGSK
jgi:hypothetical protein